MGHNLRRNFPSSDPLAFLNELTRTNSYSSGSGVTIETFRDPAANARPGQTMVWTNEMHNSYIEFLEASFVEQLHCSMSLRSSDLREEMWESCPTPQLPPLLSALRDGCHQKSNDPLLDSTADSSDIPASPLHHFISAGKTGSVTFPLSRETVVSKGARYLRSNRNSGGCTTGKSSLNLVAYFPLLVAFFISVMGFLIPC